ncbi:hypothetical protein F5890DRAFT_984310 [Lentinula detonsa]|uniref:TPR-like protein n=1 Tax=Lentinula detonsa TaxID=2804962 RepID=A0AA38UW17_9AGAR|nr:hypothetical protein F5890DRAFT_984310 [Lentinula detonsa]
MSTKDRHYWTQLRTTLTAGHWTSSSPAKAFNGAPLSWSELFRKFNKHCKGYADVAEVASQNQALALLLIANSKDEDLDEPVRPEEYPLELGDECILAPERMEEARSGYDVLKKIESSNFDTLNFALAYYAYALGDPSECLDHLSKVPDVSHVQNHIPLPVTLRANTLHVPTGGSSISTSSPAESIVGTESTISIADIKDGRAWAITETIRSLCLQGMSHEKLFPDKPRKALETYSAAFPLLTIVETELASTFAPVLTSTGKIDFSSFTRFREVWRWVERLLWRAIVLSSRIFNVHHDHKVTSCRESDSLWTWLEHYSSCSVYWPSNFRTSHRSTISVIYLRALVLRHGSETSLPALVGTARKSPHWMNTARSVIQEYRAILNVSTKFPKAGERNHKVEDFAEQCVAVWEASGAVGEYGGWVLDVLWWATRLTFNSYTIQKHMTRLLYVSGDIALARRTLRLYVQIVSKAHQAAVASNITGEELEREADTDRSWVQTCVFGTWMLCRIISSTSASVSTGRAKEIIDDLREAETLVAKAKTRLDASEKELAASVDLAEGIWLTVMAVKQHNSDTRPFNFAKAHALFLRSIDTFPTATAHYHIALSYARYVPAALGSALEDKSEPSQETVHEQNLEKAILHAASAAEGKPSEIRYWHLIGLLSAKIEKWEAAESALETGASVGEVSDASLDGNNAEDLTDAQSTARLSVPSQGTAKVNADADTVEGLPPDSSRPMTQPPLPPKEEEVPPVYVLGPITTGISQTQNLPSSSELLQPVTDHPEPSRHEKFEHALQLRMSQVAVAEYVEGAEGAADKLPEVFQWIAEKRGISGDQTQTRASIDMARSADMRLRAPSELALSTSATNSQVGHEVNVIHDVAAEQGQEQSQPRPSLSNTNSTELQPPIPITISPATPDGTANVTSLVMDKEKKKEVETDNVSERRLRVSAHTHDRDASKSKKMQQKLKSQVHKGSARISTISKKIGHGVVKNGSLRRSSSTPDFHAVLHPMSYQASSIHSRRRQSAASPAADLLDSSSPPPPPPPALPPTSNSKWNSRTAKENRLLSDLWLMSAATFRRLGKIEQAKGAIQEAEVRDEANPGVWVQLGLYYVALGRSLAAIEAFQKALLISSDDVGASVHLARLYLFPEETSRKKYKEEAIPENIDLAAGLLAHLTQGAAWDISEAWYFLAKAYGLQGRKERERDCLTLALKLSQNRGVRDLGAALGLCL